MTANEFRKAALRLRGVVESEHMSHPDFRVNGQVFASLGYPDESWGMVKLTPEQQRSFIQKAPAMFKACNGAWGRQGCTNIHLASAKEAVLDSALQAALGNVAKPRKAPATVRIKRPARSIARRSGKPATSRTSGSRARRS